MFAADLPDARAACRSALERELMLRCYSHDMAGAVMGTLGWVDLARMDGTELPPQLDQGLQRLHDLVKAYRSELERDLGPTDRSLDLLLSALEIPFTGSAGHAAVTELRLAAAIELAAPERAELEEIPGKILLRLFGLSPDAVRAVASPHLDTLKLWLRARDRCLGVAMIRVVTRSSGGNVRALGQECIELQLAPA